MKINPSPTLTRQDIIGVVGRIDDSIAAEIIATGATLEDLVEAFAWSSDETDALADAEKTLNGQVARVYEILTSDQAWAEED